MIAFTILGLLDSVMPEMNGAECFREIKKIDPEAVIVLSSGYTQDGVVSELEQVGLAGFLKKPYTLNELQAVLAKVFF